MSKVDNDPNMLLKQKEEEVKRISKELLLQREEILSQKEVIETQRDVALKQRDEIEQKKKEITSSITYARRIQAALLTREDHFRSQFSDYFILYRPKDIVSGDFYWMHRKDDTLIVAAADSTGHGVPGAFMSLMGIAFLNEIIEGQGIVRPDLILKLMSEKILKALDHKGSSNDPHDGIDIAIVSIEKQQNKLLFAGAFNPIYIIRGEGLIELKPDRKSLGFAYRADKSTFTNIEFETRPGDRIYMFSDGYSDQFGWRNNKKFMTRNFKQLLQEIQHVPLKGQKLLLENNLDNWMGELEQVDDILVMGMEI